ncbi:MAG TPA: hypothetical protein VER04_20605 [Polyangiaceae bacterium]|nr:hypothetical protein [Polyangiaceae bacterium]
MVTTWHLYDWVSVGEQETVAEHWLSTPSPKLREVEDLVRRAAAHPLSFYQVVVKEPGRGMVLVDLLTGDEHYVFDRKLSVSLPERSITLGRLLPLQGLTILDAVGPRAFPPERAAGVHREVTELIGPEPWSHATLRSASTDMLDLYVRMTNEDDARALRPRL